MVVDRGAGPRGPGASRPTSAASARRSADGTGGARLLVPPDDADALARALRALAHRRRPPRGCGLPPASAARRCRLGPHGCLGPGVAHASDAAPAPCTASEGRAVHRRQEAGDDAAALGVARLLGGAAVLAALVWRLGTEPFVDGVRARPARRRSPPRWSIAAVTTVCCAWRWRLVAARARRRGAAAARRSAATTARSSSTRRCPAACSATCTAGCHGGDGGDAGSCCAVGWERVGGQVVQVAAGLVVVLRRRGRPSAPSAWSSPRSPLRASVRPSLVVVRPSARGVLDPAAVRRCSAVSRWRRPGTSLVFLVAARAAGVDAPPTALLPLALLVLLAAAVPLNVAGLGAARGRRRLGVRRRRAGRGAGRDRRGRRTACWRWSRRCPAPSCCSPPEPSRRPPTTRRGGRPWLSAPTPCSAAACRSTATSTAPRDERLMLSNDADLDRVDEVRAGCDAILVGAATVRNDNPRLLVRDPGRRDERVARGLPPSPVKVTVTGGAELDPTGRFFTTGDTEKLVYCADATRCREARRAARRGRDRGRRRPAGSGCARLSEDLHARGVRRLMVEGGGTHPHPVPHRRPRRRAAPGRRAVLRRRLRGPARFVDDGRFPWHPDRRADAGRRTPDRRRRAAALRAVRPLRGRHDR